MPWERFIKVIPEGPRVPLYRKAACVSLQACGTFMFNRAALIMADAEDALFVQLWFHEIRATCGFTFHSVAGNHTMRLTVVGNHAARKVGSRAFAKTYGLTFPHRSVRMLPRMEGKKLTVILPQECQP